MTPAPEGETPIDLEFLKDLSDDPAEVREVVEMYLKQTSERIGNLKNEIAAGNTESVMRLSHTCAGSSGMYGMSSIAPVFRELEQFARAGDLSRGPEYMERIGAEFKRIEEFWDLYVKKLS